MPMIADLVKQAYSHWDDSEALARTGEELHDRNRLDLSREVLSRALELDASNTKAWSYLSYTYLRGFMPDKGLETLRAGVDRTDSDELRATLASFTTDDDERKALHERLEKSDDPAIRASLASARLWAGDQGAFADLQRLFESNPDHARIRETWLWVVFASAGRPGGEELDLVGDAIPVVDRKIAEDPDRINGHWMKAQMLHQAQRWDLLLDATAAALERFPDEETIMYLRGRALVETGDTDRAAECFARAIGMKPSYVGARTELGKVYEAQGKPALAEETFRDSLRANPDFAGGPVSLALFLGRQERWDEAETLFLENWAKLAPWQRQRISQQPDAKAMLERERVKEAIG